MNISILNWLGFEFVDIRCEANPDSTTAAQAEDVFAQCRSGLERKLEGAWVLTKVQQRRRRRGGGDGTPPSPIPGVPTDIAEQILEAGIAGLLVPSGNELVITGAPRWNSVKEMDFDDISKLISVRIRRSDYDTLNSRLADGEEVTFEANLQNHFSEGPFPLFNTIAEIPGTEFPDEVIIVSGHLDSGRPRR